MRVLCVHHKGGVGKTTTAVHVAGVLLATGDAVLVVDGDTQADSYRFFNRGLPPTGTDPLRVDGLDLTVEALLGRDIQETLPKMLGASDATHVVVDAQPDLGQIATLLGEAEPDLVLLCVKRDDLLSFAHLGSMFEALAQVRGTLGLSPRVSVVSAGAAPAEFEGYIPPGAVPYDIPPALPFEPLLVGRAMLGQRFVWDLPGGAAFEDGYRRLVEPMLSAP